MQHEQKPYGAVARFWLTVKKTKNKIAAGVGVSIFLIFEMVCVRHVPY